jgi:hypothetical protein
MDWGYLHSIFHRFGNVKDSKRGRNENLQRSFCEMHAGANAPPVAEADVPGISLCWPLWCGDMPFRIERE